MRSLKHRRGIVNIWVIMTLFLMIALVGLACDTGWCTLVLNQLQAAADASALAGAQKIHGNQTDARSAAVNIGHANRAARDPVQLDPNDGNAAAGDVVLGVYDLTNQTFTPTTTGPNAVKVNARRTSSSLNGATPLVFGPAMGVATADLATSAIAYNKGFIDAGLIVLHPNQAGAFRIEGGSTVHVTGGVMINSNNNCTANNNGNPQLFTPDVYTVGNSCLDSGVLVPPGQLHPGIEAFTDPLLSMPVPPLALSPANPLSVGNQGSVTINPGWYPNGIRRTQSGATLTMNKGVYVLEGGNGDAFYVNGGNVSGHGVLLYIKTGSVRLNGNGNIDLQPADSGANYFAGSEPYYGTTIFQARNNSSGADILGTGNMNLQGTMYFPFNNVDLHGTGNSLGFKLIAYTVSVTGNANITINGLFPVPHNLVYLVQ